VKFLFFVHLNETCRALPTSLSSAPAQSLKGHYAVYSPLDNFSPCGSVNLFKLCTTGLLVDAPLIFNFKLIVFLPHVCFGLIFFSVRQRRCTNTRLHDCIFKQTSSQWGQRQQWYTGTPRRVPKYGHLFGITSKPKRQQVYMPMADLLFDVKNYNYQNALCSFFVTQSSG